MRGSTEYCMNRYDEEISTILNYYFKNGPKPEKIPVL